MNTQDINLKVAEILQLNEECVELDYVNNINLSGTLAVMLLRAGWDSWYHEKLDVYMWRKIGPPKGRILIQEKSYTLATCLAFIEEHKK